MTNKLRGDTISHAEHRMLENTWIHKRKNSSKGESEKDAEKKSTGKDNLPKRRVLRGEEKSCKSGRSDTYGIFVSEREGKAMRDTSNRG